LKQFAETITRRSGGKLFHALEIASANTRSRTLWHLTSTQPTSSIVNNTLQMVIITAFNASAELVYVYEAFAILYKTNRLKGRCLYPES